LLGEDVALYAARFEILRLLPRAESTLHYRVRDMASGQERAVSEQEITPGLDPRSIGGCATPRRG
jgi:hypothetical protein